MNNPSGGGMLPTPRQELLLRAALLSAEPAQRAWQEWREQIDWAQPIETGSYRLLPLVYHNLRALKLNDPQMTLLKGIYRREWYQNQMLFHTLAEVLQLLHAAGIKTLILKGAPLSLLYYQDFGLRPMADFDVLVPTRARRAAFNALRQAEWSPQQHPPEKLTDAVLDIRHAWGFQNARKQQLDLHWHVLIECRTPDADDDFWTGAVPVQAQKVRTHALNPTDQLLHVCVHGAAWSFVPSLRWIPDALMILRVAAEQIEWLRLTQQAQKRRLTLALGHALAYLRDAFDAPVPVFVLNELAQTRVSDAEQKLWIALTAPRTWRGGMPVSWRRHCFDLEARGETRSARKWLEFPRYLQREKALDTWQLFPWAFSRAIKRLNRAVRGIDQGLR